MTMATRIQFRKIIQQTTPFYFQLLLAVMIFLFTIPALSQTSKAQKLDQFKATMQAKVKKISSALQQQYVSDCSSQLRDCSVKTYNLCEGTSPRECLNNFPFLSGCLNPGIYLAKNTGARFPNIFQSSSLDYETRKFICASALIESTFTQIFDDNHQEHSYAYIGSSTGVIRIAPSFKQEMRAEDNKCADFDPRIRPWYVSAITGPKIMVILIDISKSMMSMFPGARFRNAKVTLQIILKTLNGYDYIGIVLFSKTAKNLPNFQKIVPANQQNLKSLSSLISDIQTDDGSTNYTSAVQLGVSMRQNLITQCQSTLFVLLTDGYTQNDQTEEYKKIPQLIDSNLNGSVLLVSFVYGVEENIKYEYVESATYRYNGILFRMWDGIDQITMINKLSSFYSFMSEGSPGRRDPEWSESYEDAFGFGRIMSVSLPVYVPFQIPKIIGVASIDVFLSQLYASDITDEMINQAFRKVPQCYSGSIDNQTLQFLRCQAKNTTNCDSLEDQVVISSVGCSKSISMDVFYKSGYDTSSDDSKCCGLTLRQFYLILFLSIGAFVLAVAIGIMAKMGVFRKIYDKCRQKKNQKEVSEISSEVQSQKNMIDPENKYKDAESSGVKIYHEPQFAL